MKHILISLFTVCFVLIGFRCRAQERDYTTSIKSFDLSQLWKAVRLHIVDGGVNDIPFPEPLGFIGDNYQRFYIHYTSVVKDLADPYKYIVTGKTRVKDNVCPFKGFIKVIKAKINPDLYYGKYKQGEVICEVELMEDSTHAGSGLIRGALTSEWYLDKKQAIHYDSINFEADGFSNNQCEATWIGYKTHQHKRCNWGDFRIPESGDLDIGAGDFGVRSNYARNGWQNYMDQDSHNQLIAVKARKEEQRKWWE